MVTALDNGSVLFSAQAPFAAVAMVEERLSSAGGAVEAEQDGPPQTVLSLLSWSGYPVQDLKEVATANCTHRGADARKKFSVRGASGCGQRLAMATAFAANDCCMRAAAAYRKKSTFRKSR